MCGELLREERGGVKRARREERYVDLWRGHVDASNGSCLLTAYAFCSSSSFAPPSSLHIRLGDCECGTPCH
ncbi:hypothetical protein AX14_005134 [Amanita brunnescens Koide BX004]|nr:hypothetical protein AX14_005134 [Amanita brunnescens Koide BX004]